MAGGPVGNTIGGVLIPTILQITDDAVSYWTSMTCLYDPYFRQIDKPVLPVCMFHVKDIKESWSNEVSKKRVILYEEPTSMSNIAQPMRRGVMETASDNIVKNPKTYTLEVIVPYLPIGRYVGEGVKGLADTISILTEFVSGGEGVARDTILSAVDAALAFANGALRVANTVASVSDALSGGDGSAKMLNKNSLEAMADSGRVLCMKMWSGYDYKYVVITGLTMQKMPNEDDVFRATLQLEELPVLAVAEPTDIGAASMPELSPTAVFTRNIYAALSTPLIGITQVGDPDAGGPVQEG
jgi:hypothetical protein